MAADKSLMNGIQIEYPHHLSLIQLFETQVKRSPHCLALQTSKEALTYDQLNRRANQLAYYLRAQGVSREQVVGVSINRSSNLIISLLAILKAGAAYLPLDPQYPQERINFMLHDASAVHLVTEKVLLNHFIPHFKNITCIDDMIWENTDDTDPIIINTETDLAYLMYTSGSTGRPKGVMIEHKSIINRAYALLDIYKMDKNWRHLHYSSFSFDASIEEIFLPLFCGGRVVVALPNTGYDPGLLFEQIAQYEITGINFVPSVLQLFLDELTTKNIALISNLRCVIAGGEVLSRELVEQFYSMLSARLFNTYGPTENTIDSTYYECIREKIPSTIPIGKPLPNSSIAVLNEQLQAVEVGEVGELYVGGVGVARGYWNREDLSKRSFIFFPLNNEFIYKTGDLVYLNSEMDLEFIGRIDTQIKLRGIRIEVDEICAIIEKIESVKKCIVCLKSIKEQEPQLVAYLIKKDEQEEDHRIITAVKTQLTGSLPKNMLPSAIMLIDRVPLTVNGKMDFAALPYPLFQENDPINEPNNEIEKNVIGLCRELLKIPAIHLMTDFFSVGHSLLAIRFISRLRDYFKIEIPVSLLFENPVLKDLAAKISELVTTAPGKINDFIAQAPRSEPLPVSYQQQAIWFIEQFGDVNNAFDLPAIYDLEGELDIATLEKSFEILIAKNEILRTTFIKHEEDILQKIHAPAQFTIPLHDLSNDNWSTVLNKAGELTKSIAKQTFDLVKGPLIRVNLLILSKDYYRLLINVHHMIFDGHSVTLMAQELSSLYTQLKSEQRTTISPLWFQYADYAYHQRQVLEKSFAEKMNFWRQLLTDALPILQLPTDFPRPKILSLQGKTTHFSLSKSLTHRLYQLAKSQNCTLYSVLLSAFLICLYRHTNQTDMTIGTALSNRNFAEIENLIGYFINILPIRVQLDVSDNFLEVLKRTHNTVLKTITHNDVPFELIVKELKATRDTAYSPIFQIAFVLENSSQEQLSLPGLRSTTVRAEQYSAKYDLTIHIDEQIDQLIGKVEFNLNLFREQTIDRFISHFSNLLEEITSYYAVKKINELDMLSREEKASLVQFNNTQLPFLKQDYLLQQMFLEQTQLLPQQLAVYSELRQLTYQELKVFSQNLALQLQESGAKPNELIAIILPKSCEQIIAALAILQSGAAYLPINYDYPEKRIAQLLKEGCAKIIVTDGAFATRNRWLNEYCYILIELVNEEENMKEFNCPQTNRDLAYVIFTSGSTGIPKGVMIDHHGAVNTVLDINSRFNINSQDAVLGISDINFDLSVYDIFGTLAAGATLILPQDRYAKDPQHWLSLFSQKKITVWNSVPALMQVFCDYLSDLENLQEYQCYLQHLRLVLLSGDWVPLSLPAQIKRIFRDEIQIISLGGATEASIWSILYPIEQIHPEWDSIPYGKPMSNQEFTILNSALMPVPIGVTGDLYISGKGIAKGYWQDQEKTAKSFFYHPSTGEYLYKTGDMGYYLADGNIVFRGRADNQIKINGMRIELGEITTKLLEHPDINKALVTVTRHAHNLENLVAYYQPKSGRTVSPSQLQTVMSEIFPQYMVPKYFIAISQLPLTSNGKVDISALPKINEIIQEYIQPQSSTEIHLASLWRQLLKHQNISLNDNFFTIGGHSLLAIKLVTQIQNEFNVKFSIRDLFSHSQLKQLSSFIDSLMIETHILPIEEGVI